MNEFYDRYCNDHPKENVSEKNSRDLDTLTQIANRQKFEVMFAEAIRKSQIRVCYLSIFMIKIDDFNDFNDTFGRLAGDDCLRQVALTLKNTLQRSEDLAARWDNEKFACILSDTDPDGAEKMAEKIRTKILELAIPCSPSAVAEVVTVSIGVVTSILTDETAYQTLLAKADQALSTAREMGQNQIFSCKY